jgi:hypothetical protein
MITIETKVRLFTIEGALRFVTELQLHRLNRPVTALAHMHFLTNHKIIISLG